MGQQIEIDKAVVQRCDQRIGQRMGDLTEAGMRPRAVDQDKVRFGFQFGHSGGQAVVIDVFAGLERRLINLGQFLIDRAGQIEPFCLKKLLPVPDVAAGGLLAQVQIQDAHAMPRAAQGRCNVHGNRRFPRTALFVSDNYNMRHLPSLIYIRMFACGLCHLRYLVDLGKKSVVQFCGETRKK